MRKDLKEKRSCKSSQCHLESYHVAASLVPGLLVHKNVTGVVQMDHVVVVVVDNLTTKIARSTFVLLLNVGYFPLCWSDGYTTPIHKSGESSDPNNYRGISIDNCLENIFTLLLNSRLTNYLNPINI